MPNTGAPAPAKYGERFEVDAPQVTDQAEPPPGDLPDAERPLPSGSYFADEAMAREEARRLGRPLFVVFAAEWCVPCRLIEADALSDERVKGAIAKSFISLFVDVTEETRAERDVLARYAVRGIPTLIVLDSAAQELERVESYIDADGLLAVLSRARERSSE